MAEGRDIREDTVSMKEIQMEVKSSEICNDWLCPRIYEEESEENKCRRNARIKHQTRPKLLKEMKEDLINEMNYRNPI